MRWTWIIAAAGALTVTGALLAAPSAQAATKKQKYYYVQRSPGTIVYTRDENGRTRTRVLVERRSYLDGGTEVLPGERKFTDYVFPPNYSALGVLGPGRGWTQAPVPPYMGFYGIGTW
jgi:hypothetical protein